MNKLLFILVIFLAFLLRLYGLNWDSGYHFHPDERMIIMVADRIRLPKTYEEWQTVFTPQSPLNPKFFAYGSYPIYLLKSISFLFQRDDYNGRLLVGRLIAVAFEIGTVILVFLIGQTIADLAIKKKKPKTEKNYSLFEIHSFLFPFLSSYFYAVCVLPIQSSHFFISDIPLTFLTTLTLYLSLLLATDSQGLIRNSSLLGLSLGLSLATKVTAVLLLIPMMTALFLFFLHFRRLKTTLVSLFLILFFCASAFSLTMPYAIIDFPTFKAHTLEQSRMRTDPFVFPFTLQYVNTTPYLYFLKNILFWGMGLPLGSITLLGAILVTLVWIFQIINFLKTKQKIDFFWICLSILVIFFWLYFAFMGKSAVKFMRYMLPIYPLSCLFGSFFTVEIWQKWSKLSKLCLLFILISISFWPMMFMTIYARPQTRIAASHWIYKNIPPGAKLGLEHWDDALPVPLPGYKNNYLTVEFPLYESDTPKKWEMMEKKIKETDYIILASNRLYVPLMKLVDCENLPVGRCYRQTAQYYQKLFDGRLGFTKVAEFTSYPQFPISQIGPISLIVNDDSADESFTVYDHPKIMIFKKDAQTF